MLSDEISTRTPSMERRELGMLTLQLRQAVSEAEAEAHAEFLKKLKDPLWLALESSG